MAITRLGLNGVSFGLGDFSGKETEDIAEGLPGSLVIGIRIGI